eukprot:CAMPEP_0180174152 /NCGR_PEP_ID=MMETSP0986-20121125/35983_1 /TAXON_ID=697907 /ORGANISM="non described non described, Strain CCMP2293" /LENGTH=64 /DNA_ID=CAMNT_0022126441 /DNA_START=21 /DNA_END=211 /DNA_ORIENTATION=-
MYVPHSRHALKLGGKAPEAGPSYTLKAARLGIECRDGPTSVATRLFWIATRLTYSLSATAPPSS